MITLQWLNKLIILVLLLAILGTASAKFTFDANKNLVINGTPTFMVGMYYICVNWGATEPCNASISKLPQFKFSLQENNYDATNVNAYENASIYYTITYDNSSTKVNATIAAGRDHAPHFLGYMTDEPDNHAKGTHADFVSVFNTINSSSDGIAITNLYTDALRDWNDTAHVLTWDTYPIATQMFAGWGDENEAYTRADFLYGWEHNSKIQIMRDFGDTNADFNSVGRPVWTYIQANGFNITTGGNTVLVPTFQEIRAQTYTALTMDLKGIILYGYQKGAGEGMQENPLMVAGANNLSKELKGLNNILILPTDAFSWQYKQNFSTVYFNPNPTKTVQKKTVKRFNYILKHNSTADRYYLIAVNKDANQTTTNISISGLTGVRLATTLGLETTGSQAAGRQLLVTNGTFTDTFNGYAAHTYEIALAYPRYDVIESGIVDIYDLTLVGQHYNEVISYPYPRYDVNMNGLVNIEDITIVGQHFGENT